MHARSGQRQQRSRPRRAHGITQPSFMVSVVSADVKRELWVSYARLGEGALVESLERHYPVVAGTTARHTQYEFLTS